MQPFARPTLLATRTKDIRRTTHGAAHRPSAFFCARPAIGVRQEPSSARRNSRSATTASRVSSWFSAASRSREAWSSSRHAMPMAPWGTKQMPMSGMKSDYATQNNAMNEELMSVMQLVMHLEKQARRQQHADSESKTCQQNMQAIPPAHRIWPLMFTERVHSIETQSFVVRIARERAIARTWATAGSMSSQDRMDDALSARSSRLRPASASSVACTTPSCSLRRRDCTLPRKFSTCKQETQVLSGPE